MPASFPELLPKLSDVDPDLRFMALKDLQELLSSPDHKDLYSDANMLQISTKVFTRLGDNISEVQNEALKW